MEDNDWTNWSDTGLAELFLPIGREQHIELIRHADIPQMQRLRELFNVGLRGAELQRALRPVGVTFKRADVTAVYDGTQRGVEAPPAGFVGVGGRVGATRGKKPLAGLWARVRDGGVSDGHS